VLDLATGAKVAGALVTTSPPTVQATTDAEGKYTLAEVPIGVYSVSASKEGFVAQPAQVSVTAGATVDLNLALIPGKGYAGSDICGVCHNEQYNEFRASGHPYKLRTAAQAKGDSLPLPAGCTWDDIAYVIGGYKWKSRYIGKDGYILTSNCYGEEGKNQYNLMTGVWKDYHPGEVKPYNCGRCHTTGYFEEGHQDGLPGIVGTWVMPGIQCEACHGPALLHISRGGDKTAIKVDRSAELCGKCHVRGDPTKIPAKGGFVRHHEQYNELLASPHKAMGCVACHDPHRKAEFSIKTECKACHTAQDAEFTGSEMQKVGVTCIDCHMPMASKSAEILGPNKGDVRTHLFRINTDPEASMFTDDGKYAKDFVELRFACLGCHIDKDVTWAAQHAKGVHSLGK
jgi:hypothetical protein